MSLSRWFRFRFNCAPRSKQ